MRMLLATPIYPPQVGGPAWYSARLAEALRRQGHEVEIQTYGALMRMPPALRHFLYMLRLLAPATRADAIIALDTFSVGFPAALVSALTRTPLFVRVGGDFLWERYLERTGDLVPLPRIYQKRARWGGKERLVFAIVRYVARHAHLVFSSQWQLDIWSGPYGLDAARVSVIENAIQEKSVPVVSARKNFLFYARPIALKNAPAFRRAFEKAKAVYPEVELEEGTVSHEELLRRMRACYAVVVPSISDITPNIILDALSCGKPFLLTKYSAYAERFEQFGVIVDPLDEADMARGVQELADSARYDALCAKIAAFNEKHTYETIARKFVALIEKKI